MAVNNVCRLCLSEKELCWVFDQSLAFSGNMKSIIRITTGVEISERDIISQKVCKNCFQLTVTMFKFRERAAKTDKYLQDQSKEPLLTCEMSIKAPHTKKGGDDAAEQEETVTATITGSPIRILSNVRIESSPEDTDLLVKDITMLCRKKTHQSIENIFATYADIKLPPACLRLDLNPTVCMEMSAVEEYFRSRNLDMTKAIETVLKSSRAPINENPSDKEARVPDVVSNDEARVVPSIDVAGTNGEENKGKSQIGVKRTIENCENESSEATVNEEKERSIDSQKVRTKRPRLSSSDSTSEPAPTLMDTLRLQRKENLIVHRCNICCATQTTGIALRKHLQEHFKCQYCRIRFRILQRKEKHLETCIIKQALNTKPYIELQRIDDHFKRLNGASSTEETCGDENNHIGDHESDESKVTEGTTSREDTTLGQDIIEILSDDEEDNSPSTLSVASVIQTAPSLVPVEQIPPSIYSSTGIVKPAIKIKDNALSDLIDTTNTDVELFRELLDRTMPLNLKISVAGSTQTEPPSNEQLVVNASNNTAELKELMSQLKVFKIPVDIKKGDFNVTYTKNKIPEKKQVKCWDTRKAMEIISPNVTLFNDVTLSERISMGIPLLRPVETRSQIIPNSALSTNMSRRTGTNHSSDVISNSNQNLQSVQTQRTSHQPNQNQSINAQHSSLQTQWMTQNINTQSPQLNPFPAQRAQQQNQYHNINTQSALLNLLQTQNSLQQYQNENMEYQSTQLSSQQTQSTWQQNQYQNTNPQSAQFGSIYTRTQQQDQNQNINSQYRNQYLARKTLQNQNMQLPHNVSQNLQKYSSPRISPNVLQSLKPLRVQQNMKPPRVQQNLKPPRVQQNLKPPRIQQNMDPNLIHEVSQTMNQSLFQVPQNAVLTTNSSTTPAYYVQSVAAVPESVAPDISGLSYATQSSIVSSSNVTVTNISQNLNISIDTTWPPLTSENVLLSNWLDGALNSRVNSSVTNNEMCPNVNFFRNNSLSEKTALYPNGDMISVDTSVATSESNNSTATKRPLIRVKNLCDLK